MEIKNPAYFGNFFPSRLVYPARRNFCTYLTVQTIKWR